MRIRTVLATSSVLVAALLAGDASAASVTVTDTAGDANGVNGQGVVAGPAENTATPGSQNGFDILGMTFSSTFTGKGKTRAPKDLVIVVNYAGRPDETSSVHLVNIGASGGCDSPSSLLYFAGPLGKSAVMRTCTDGSDPTATFHEVDLSAPKVGDKTLTWTISYKLLAALPVPFKTGTSLTDLGAQSRYTHAVNLPVMDLVRSTSSYKLGS